MHPKFIRQTASRLLAACLTASGLIAAVITTTPVAAACATPATNYGSASMQLSVPTASNYRIWTRLQAPDTVNNSYFLEIDGNSCYVVGDGTLAAKTWTWVGHQNGDPSSTIVAPLNSGAHTLKLIGREPGVKIDRILAAADQACIPANLGENCMQTADITQPTVAITAPADNSTVNGTVIIKATATDNTSISRVEFYIQDQLVYTDTSSPYEYGWSTAGLNGTYTITAKAYDPAGNSSADSQALTVKSGDTQPPSAPSRLVGNTAYNSVALTWQASTDDTGVAGYRVVRNNTVIATIGTPAYTDTSVTPGTAYQYYIVAYDQSNNVSSASNTISVTTAPAPISDTQSPTAPSDVVATAISNSQINLAWKSSTDNVGIKQYDIYRSTDTTTATKIASTTSTSYGDGGLSANTRYSYYITARDAAGNAASSPIVNATTLPQSNPQQETSTLRGTIHGRHGRPITGAKITIWVNGRRYQASTNWRGNYIIANVPSGRYEVSVRASGYHHTNERVRLRPGKTKWYDVSLRRY